MEYGINRGGWVAIANVRIFLLEVAEDPFQALDFTNALLDVSQFVLLNNGVNLRARGSKIVAFLVLGLIGAKSSGKKGNSSTLGFMGDSSCRYLGH